MQTDTQVLYLGRWVPREHFRAFVYNSTGTKLVENYEDFSKLISSGVWFAEKKDIEGKVVSIKSKRGRKCRNQQSQ